MTYGKLLVYLPDGAVEEHPLIQEVTSIGRQPGNDIVIPTIAVSRYHAQITARQGQVFIIDLETVNNTYVNDTAIASNEEVPLTHGDEVAMGDARIVFIAPGEDEGDSTTVRREPITTTVIEGRAPLRIALDEPNQSVAPGARLRLGLLIENPSEETQQYVITLAGMDPEWAKANRREVRLNPGEQSEVTISVKPPRSSSTTPGAYPLVVSAALKDDPSLYLEAACEIDVVGYSGLGMVVREGRQPSHYQVAVQNQGNVPVRVRLGGFHPPRKLRFAFDRVELELAPGQTEQVGLTVRPRGGGPFGGSERTAFAVVARSLDAANYQAPVSIGYTITPSWSAWAAGLAIPIGGLIVVLLTIAALVVFLPGIISPRQPSPSATAMVIPAETDVTTTALTPTETPTTTVTESAPAPASNETASFAAPPPAADVIQSFVIAPSTVLTHQTGQVTLSWDVVENAADVSVTQYDPNGGAIPLELLSEEGPHSIPIADLAAVPGQYDYALYVAGEDGAAYTETVTLTVVATCTILGNSEPAYAQPGDTNPIGTLVADERVEPLAQAVDNLGWLWVSYASGTQQGWVRREALACPGISDLSAVVFPTSP